MSISSIWCNLAVSRLGEVLTANSELVARPLAISGAVGKIANVGKIAEPVGKIALAIR